MRYFFDLLTSRGLIPDPEGAYFASDDEAILEAEKEALGMAADLFRDGCKARARTIVVRDPQGRLIAEVDVSTIAKRFLD